MQVTDDQGEFFFWGPDAYFYTPGHPSYWGSGGASATVTATFTWTPDPNNPSEPPTPLCVLETAMADAVGGNDMASADNGLGDAAIIVDTSYGTTASCDAYSDGSHLTLAGTTSPVVLTHTLSSTCPKGITNTLSYQASAYPVTLDLGGTTPGVDGNASILVGQHCTAGLSGGGGTLSGWQWDVGGTTFQSWSPNTPATSTSFGTGASQYVDGPGPLTNFIASWYWNDPQTTPETVSCTATVTPPDGEGPPFTVTAQKQVTVYIPKVVAYGVGGNMQVNASSQGDSNIELYAGGTPGSSNPGGINWHATVSSPVPALFGAGSLAIAQVISPYASIAVFNQPQFAIKQLELMDMNAETAYMQVSTPELSRPITTTHFGSENGQTGLDGGFPYPWGDNSYFGGDEPGIALDNSIQSAYLSDSFVDYLMYQAPGSSQWVPVSTFYWSTNGSASIPSTGNWADFVGSAGTVTPSGSSVNFRPSNSFPSWTQTLGPGTFL